MKPTVFVTHPLPGAAQERLHPVARVLVADKSNALQDERLPALAQDVEGLLTLLTDRIDHGVLDRFPRLRIVANMAVGVDNIDVQACRSRGVLVTNTPGVLTEATADLAFGLLLAAGRRIAEADAFVRRGEWKGWSPDLCLGTTIHGLTLGIVGMGRIGQAMARRARGFGMHVLYHQRKALSADMERALGVRHVPLDALFRECDAISLHCPLTDDTRGLVSAERLQSMKKGALLVNTARGACIDEKALAHALEHGPLGAAGLDVFQNEPVVEPALLRCTNVVLTPHIASADRRTREAMARTAVDNLLEVFSGRPALTPV